MSDKTEQAAEESDYDVLKHAYETLQGYCDWQKKQRADLQSTITRLQADVERLKNGGWINGKKQTPALIDGEDYSKNVYAIVNGIVDIACYCYIAGEGFAWASCNGEINGDAEFDDDYDVTFWQPIPEKPTEVLTPKE